MRFCININYDETSILISRLKIILYLCACVCVCLQYIIICLVHVHDNNNVRKIFLSRRNESVLRCDRNDTRSSAERHIRVHDSGEPVSASRTDDAIVNNFFPPSVGGGGGCVDDDGPTRIYAAHHRGTPCAAATSRVH